MTKKTPGVVTTPEPGRGGWTDWIFPKPGISYRMICCDCGLVHDMQFKAFRETNRKRDGSFTAEWMSLPYRAMFRARRARK